MPIFSWVCNGLGGGWSGEGEPCETFLQACPKWPMDKATKSKVPRSGFPCNCRLYHSFLSAHEFVVVVVVFFKWTDCQATVFIPESCSQCVKVILCNAVKAESIPLTNWCAFTWSLSCWKFVSVNWGWGELVRVILRYTVNVRQISDCSWVRDARNTSLHLGRVHPRC